MKLFCIILLLIPIPIFAQGNKTLPVSSKIGEKLMVHCWGSENPSSLSTSNDSTETKFVRTFSSNIWACNRSILHNNRSITLTSTGPDGKGIGSSEHWEFHASGLFQSYYLSPRKCGTTGADVIAGYWEPIGEKTIKIKIIIHSWSGSGSFVHDKEIILELLEEEDGKLILNLQNTQQGPLFQ